MPVHLPLRYREEDSVLNDPMLIIAPANEWAVIILRKRAAGVFCGPVTIILISFGFRFLFESLEVLSASSSLFRTNDLIEALNIFKSMLDLGASQSLQPKCSEKCSFDRKRVPPRELPLCVLQINAL